MNRDKYCTLLAKGISEQLNTKITEIQVSEQLMLIELGMKPTDEVIGKWIEKTATKGDA